MSKMGSLAIDLISYEEGALDDADTLNLFATLVKSGMAWTLQGHYGRTARNLIDSGFLTEEGEVTEHAVYELDLL
ncbi:hypothetical protein SEA_VERSE_65 [Streptomyces phage Verse]|uniref:DUF7417 domain-containing protein n=2 Tax=Streptomyces phage Amela TaxID=1673877 RepID=A0A0K1YAB0_9CAUD|nr:hypothetical protein AVT29_gp64 [Streptomyces phage Amela]AKY03819.1 hypothetical protein SEA_AMELA_64 [Streptomyces phage Amela]AKY03895.1 hypothetical protein SEA_VERSE_65 [Streptomyces phage Verse]